MNRQRSLNRVGFAFVAAAVGLAMLTGCVPDKPNSLPPESSDAATTDSGTTDTATTDSSTTDTGVADAGAADAGATDSSVTDSGTPDSNTPDGSSGGSTPPGGDASPGTDDFIVNPEGLQRLVIGMTEKQLQSNPLIRWDAVMCATDPDGKPTQNPGRWVSVNQDERSIWGDLSSEFFVEVLDEQLVRLDIHSVEITDSKGIHIGSSEVDFKKAYPQAKIVFKGPISDVYLVEQTPTSNMIYELSRDDSKPGYWGDLDRTVFQIRILDAHMDYVWATAGSGNIAGGCF